MWSEKSVRCHAALTEKPPHLCHKWWSGCHGDHQSALGWTQWWPACCHWQPVCQSLGWQWKVCGPCQFCGRKGKHNGSKFTEEKMCSMIMLLHTEKITKQTNKPQNPKQNTYFSVSKVNFASRFPMLRISSVLELGYLTAQVVKCTSSGKSRIALAPIAWTGTTNFSRSVWQISSCS